MVIDFHYGIAGKHDGPHWRSRGPAAIRAWLLGDFDEWTGSVRSLSEKSAWLERTIRYRRHDGTARRMTQAWHTRKPLDNGPNRRYWSANPFALPSISLLSEVSPMHYKAPAFTISLASVKTFRRDLIEIPHLTMNEYQRIKEEKEEHNACLDIFLSQNALIWWI